ncbi:prenyltransferase [Pseudomonas sp. N040]|nr:prenyltransferase [Pseudomonas sp. N040]
MPHLDAQDWQAMGLVKRWFVASRSAVFIMTLVSAGLGIALAAQQGAVDPLNALLALLGLTLAHATNNLLNDWVDFRKGVDRDNYFRTRYGPQPLESGLLSESALLGYVLLTGLAAFGCGVWLVLRTDLLTLYLLLAGMFFVLFYTWPLKYIGLGEPAVWLVWGPLMVLGSCHVAGGALSAAAICFSLIYGLGPTTVLLGKHTDKLAEDRAKRVHTLPVILGERASRLLTIACWLVQYTGISLAVWLGILGWPFLLVWLALPKLIKAIRVFLRPRPTQAPVELPAGVWPLYLVAFAFDHNRAFSLALLVAVTLHWLF